MRVMSRYRLVEGHSTRWSTWAEVFPEDLADWLLQAIAFMGGEGKVTVRRPAGLAYQWKVER